VIDDLARDVLVLVLVVALRHRGESRRLWPAQPRIR
jgi:hypothetical protein